METATADVRQRTQVETILRSETLRGSEVLPHLLRFLADKTFSGEADGLKEYTVAIDALRKPPTYNPQHDSAVRIQVGRLRQKLAEYYLNEGKDDPLIVSIPKGRFKVTFEERAPAPELESPPTIVEPRMPVPKRGLIPWLSILLAAAVIWGVVTTFKLRQMQAAVASPSPNASSWNSDIQKLWGPFFNNSRPLILGVEDPLFMEVQKGEGIYYRDRAIDDWGTLMKSREAQTLHQMLDRPAVQPSHYYTPVGEVSAAFLVGKLAAAEQQHVSIVRSSELSWQQLADNNILIVGKESFFDAQIQAMPIPLPFSATERGIENPNPNPGEPKLFANRYSGAPAEEGEVYALITHLPGVAGKGEFASFVSNRAAGYVGALQWATDPQSAKILVGKLANAKGQVPTHYQTVLKIKFKDEVPLEISYVLSRTLD